jgi:hypothetical protein
MASTNFAIKDDLRIGRSMRTGSLWPRPNTLHRRLGRGDVGRLVAWFVLTIMEDAMTLYEEQQAALAELEKARRRSFLLKGLISDPLSMAEFREANDEVIRAAELCAVLANKVAPATAACCCR